MKVGLPLIKSALTPLARSILIPLEITAASAAVEPAIHKKYLVEELKVQQQKD